MSAYSTLRHKLDVDSNVVDGKEDRHAVEQEITRVEVSQCKQMDSPSTAAVYYIPVTVCKSVDTEIVTEPSLSFLRRLSPKAIRKCAKVLVARLAESNKIKTKKDTEMTDALHFENFDRSTQQQPRNALPYTRDASRDRIHNGDTRALGLPRVVCAISSDNASTWSGDSNDNEYDLMAKVEGRVGEVLVSVDSQAPRSFIFRQALNELGGFKERNIPDGARAYKSPLNPLEETVATKFVELRLNLYQISERIKAKLVILEVPEVPNGFQVILGRDSVRKLGGGTLFRRIEEANTHRPHMVVSVDKSYAAPLRRAKKKSQKQVEDDEANLRTLQKKQRQEQAELYGNGDNITPLSAGSSTQSPSASASSHWAGCHLPGCYLASSDCGQSAVRQSGQRDAVQLPDAPYWPIQRTETSSTQFTEFSFNRRDTSSSVSSWPSSVLAYVPKEGERASGALAPRTRTGIVSTEEEITECE